MTRDRCLERGRKKQGRGNDSCHFFDHYFLPCFVYSTNLFQNKSQTINYGNIVGTG